MSLSSALSSFSVDISRIVKSSPIDLIGRDLEKKYLSRAWNADVDDGNCRPHVITFVALGGEGKTSLVSKWITDEMVAKGWIGCGAAFAWSFYSQGARDQSAVSSDFFLKEALDFFGDEMDKELAASNAGAFEKGRRLAQIVGQQRSLLILDGLEPLQFHPLSHAPGQLKDQGIIALLRGLSAFNLGLCIVTTRYSIADLIAFRQTTAPEMILSRLSRAAGTQLLKKLGVKGSVARNIPYRSEMLNQFEKLVEDVGGHALTLNLIGAYLRDAHAGDIRKCDLVKLDEADAEEQGGHAFRVIEAYQLEFEKQGKKGLRALTILRILGLFDRPMTSDCFDALTQNPIIQWLTETLTNSTQEQLNITLSKLEHAKLITISRDSSGKLQTLDAHPILREYFEKRLREDYPEAWRIANRRLYEHLCTSAPESTEIFSEHSIMRTFGAMYKGEPSLEDLQPLYQAIRHACNGGWYQKAWSEVFEPRILRGTQFYSYQKLGAVGPDLGALACFFTTKWTIVSTLVTNPTRVRLLNAAGLRLRMLGRLSEALEAHQEAVKSEDQKDPIGCLRNLSETQLELGLIEIATANSAKGLGAADAGKDPSKQTMMLSTYGSALYNYGREEEAENCFRKAERILKEADMFPFLSSLHGFRYCDLLLGEPERAVWRLTLKCTEILPPSQISVGTGYESEFKPKLIEICQEVSRRVGVTLRMAETHFGPMDIGLDYLTLGRSALYQSILRMGDTQFEPKKWSGCFDANCPKLDQAINFLYRSGSMDQVSRALLSRAYFRHFTKAQIGPESAQSDLDDAWEIAKRGPMKLLLADIHLYRAGLFLDAIQYPWESPWIDLVAAETLIVECGYHRRDEELAELRAAIVTRTS